MQLGGVARFGPHVCGGRERDEERKAGEHHDAHHAGWAEGRRLLANRHLELRGALHGAHLDHRVHDDLLELVPGPRLVVVDARGHLAEDVRARVVDERPDGGEDLVERAAVDGGASVAVGGSAIDGPGYFFAPTVLSGVDPGASITREEIFGPVAPVIPFADHDAMVAHANDTEMGLAAYVYTEDLAKGLRTAERLESGMVGLNRGATSDPAAPFGGMKQSGLGREGASEGIYEFCETQYIAASW